MGDEETIQIATFPCVPFILTAVEKEGNRRHFVIDKWEGNTIDIDNKGAFTQTFTWTAHKASEKEIEEFLKEERE